MTRDWQPGSNCAAHGLLYPLKARLVTRLFITLNPNDFNVNYENITDRYVHLVIFNSKMCPWNVYNSIRSVSLLLIAIYFCLDFNNSFQSLFKYEIYYYTSINTKNVCGKIYNQYTYVLTYV